MKSKKHALRNRILFYGGFLTATLGFYFYQPVRIDLFPNPAPKEIVAINPDEARLFGPTARVAIVTAHPDDCEYYAGALVAKLKKVKAQVHLIVLTDGDKGFYPWVDAAAVRKVRRAEQTAAAKAWGARQVTYLGFPDGRLRLNEDTIQAVRKAVGDAEWVFSFDGVYPPKVSHGDHRTAGQIADAASVGKWFLRFATRVPNHTFDLTGFDLEQRQYLDLHASQFSGEKEARVWGAVFESGLTDGERIGKEYGLSVRVSRLGPPDKVGKDARADQ